MEQFRPFNIEVGLVTDFSVNSPKLRLIMLQNLLDADYLTVEGNTVATLVTDAEALVDWIVSKNTEFRTDIGEFAEKYPVTEGDDRPNLDGFTFGNEQGYL